MIGRRALPVLAACGVALAGCTGNGGADEPVTADTVRPDVSAEDCQDPDADLTQAEWVKFCADAEDPPEPSTVGDTVEFVDGEGNAGQVTLHGVSRTTEQADDYYTEEPPSSGSWLLVDVTIEATAGQVQSGTLVFAAWDDTGVQYQPTFGNIARPKEWLPDATLQAGRKATGVLAFDAPPVHLMLDFEGFISSTPLATFEIPGDAAAVPPAAPATPTECVGYGCSPEQDAEIDQGEADAND